MTLSELPALFATTRGEVHRVAVHVLGRRRHELSGKFGLRATPGGIGTPAAGPDHEVVRTDGTMLVRERTGSTSTTDVIDLASCTLAEAALCAGADLSAPFSAGVDTPSLGTTEERLAIDAEAAAALARWFAFSWSVLDATVAHLTPEATPSVIQLWPEHFDAAFVATAERTRKVNLGASPGDGYSPAPYLYVGPWDADRPGDASYWNAPFGAVLGYDDLRAAGDPAATGIAFLRRGYALLATPGGS